MKTVFVAALTACFLFPACREATALSLEGAGLHNCSEFNELRKKESYTEEHFFSWAEGFMSGMNVARLNDKGPGFESMTPEEQKEKIKNFCESNPDKKYFDAVVSVYTTVYPDTK